jgi:Flp pilus assembly protein CpaB
MELTRKRPTVPRFSGLPSSRSGALILALVCALAATGMIVYGISKYRQSIDTSSRQDTVLVATQLIQKGSSGDAIAAQGLFRATPVLEKHLVVGAITNSALIHGRVAAQDILPGQQLTQADFTTSAGVVSELSPVERAMAIPLDSSHGLLPVLHAGDRVDVYAGMSASVSSTQTGSGSGSGSASAGLRLLMTNVPVLSVGNGGGGGGGFGGAGGATQADVLLKVNAADAGALAFASDNGKIWLVLRGANAITPKTQNGVIFSVKTVLNGTAVSSSGGAQTTSGTGGHP